MRRWLLPEAIEDVLPAQARIIERMRGRLLNLFHIHGYELVAPPMLEFVESLLVGSAHDLDLRTFKLVDQQTGRMLGVRADTTPQVARIDAHLLNRKGVARLCYCGTALHTLPGSFQNTREPLQLGAELYGHAGLEADVEVLRLLAHTLELAEVPVSRIDLGHVGVFEALCQQAGLDAEQEQALFAAMQARDVPTLRELVADVVSPWRDALLALPQCYGEVSELSAMRKRMPDHPAVQGALDELQQLVTALQGLPLSIDLSDLRGYHYHTGVVFAAYCRNEPQAIALGGRYDNMGKAYGRSRPATGFSVDLRQLARLVANGVERQAILAPADADPTLQARIEALRAAGEAVVVALPGHEGTWLEAGCTRQLIKRDGEWVLQPLATE